MFYVICGPTGIGKTNLAVKLAERFSCEIISFDAFQIYKDMDIGTGKISPSENGYDKHHLINLITPNETYSVKNYQTDFRELINKISKNCKDIVMVGGTGLYIKAALFDYHFEEYNDDVSDLEVLSNEELYNKLKELDPEALNSIHINNKKRLIRAISIARSCSKTKTQNISTQEHKMLYDNVRFIFINPPREEVYDRINARVDQMISLGLVDEVRNLETTYKLSLTAKEAIGYKEILEYLHGNCSLVDAINLIKQRSRNYAKRQITFFKHQFETEEFSSIEQAYEAIVNGKLF